MGDMGMPNFIVDWDVIKKDKDKIMQKELKDMVHETLEGGRCIAKVKGNHQELIMALMGAKNSFGNIDLLHANIFYPNTWN